MTRNPAYSKARAGPDAHPPSRHGPLLAGYQGLRISQEAFREDGIHDHE